MRIIAHISAALLAIAVGIVPANAQTTTPSAEAVIEALENALSVRKITEAKNPQGLLEAECEPVVEVERDECLRTAAFVFRLEKEVEATWQAAKVSIKEQRQSADQDVRVLARKVAEYNAAWQKFMLQTILLTPQTPGHVPDQRT